MKPRLWCRGLWNECPDEEDRRSGWRLKAEDSDEKVLVQEGCERQKGENIFPAIGGP